MSNKKETSQPEKKAGLLRRLWNCLRNPSPISLGVILLVGMLIGVFSTVSFDRTMEVVGSNEFCISCHEMENTPYKEYLLSTHYSNDSGVQATCSDCHTPKAFVPMMVRKMEASKEVYGNLMGVIDTPEKYESRRLQMAETEWARMRGQNSVTCLECHNPALMQKSFMATFHVSSLDDKKACIDCHKGVVHKLPVSTAKPVRVAGDDPALVLHSIEGFKIDQNMNTCLQCHSREQSPAGATAIHPSHYVDRDGRQLDALSPSRYFCTACHVSQNDKGMGG